MDFIPFFRFVAAIIVFGIMFYFLAIMITGVVDIITFEGQYASVITILWGALPAVVLFTTGIRLIMVQQKRGG